MLLQPLEEFVERKLAHSLRLALARITAPAARRLSTRKASAGGRCPFIASDPAVVSIASAVSMFAFSTTGMPCSGPRDPVACLSASSSAAISTASGLTSMIELSIGPCRSTASILSR